MISKKLHLTALVALSLIYSSMAQTLPTYVPTKGLQGWWPFNGNANDESGNKNNGTVNGATLTTDRNGNANSAYSFNGTNNSITIPDTDSLSFLTNNFTFSFWLNWNPSTTQELAILGKRGSQTSNFEYYFEKTPSTSTSPNCIMPHTWNLGGSNVYQFPTLSSNSSSSGIWDHFVITADSIICKVYKNGVFLFSSLAPAFKMGNSQGDLTIGTGGGWGSTNWMNGTLDDMGIWNRALTESEITILFDSLKVNINKISSGNLLSVFPNPSKSLVNLKTDKKLVGSDYTVYKYFGQSVLTGKIYTENTTIDLDNFANGIYLLSVGENGKHTFKIIKE